MLVFLGLLCVSRAHAAAPDRCLADPVCSRQNDEAAKLAAQTSYERALAVLEQTYERFAEPRLLVNIGRCHFRLGRARQALASYQALQAALPDPEPELLERLQLYITEAKQAIAASAADRVSVIEDKPASVPSAAPEQPSDTPPRPPPNRCLEDATCQQQSDQAARLAGRTQYEQALALYERAYERSQEPRLLVNIGRCYFRLGRAGKALDSFFLLRRTLPQLEAEITAQLEPFIADAKLALVAENGVVQDEQQKLAQQKSAVALVITEPKAPSRPRWRVGLGVGMLAVGAVLTGLGGYALSQNGSCVTPSEAAMEVCAAMVRPDGQRSTLLVDGITPGVSLVVVGGALVVSGVTLLALPPPRKQTAWRLPENREPALLAR